MFALLIAAICAAPDAAVIAAMMPAIGCGYCARLRVMPCAVLITAAAIAATLLLPKIVVSADDVAEARSCMCWCSVR